jgi:hypothetical protein
VDFARAPCSWGCRTCRQGREAIARSLRFLGVRVRSP